MRSARISPEITEPDLSTIPQPPIAALPKIKTNNNRNIVSLDEQQKEDAYATEMFCCCGAMLTEGVGFFIASFARSPSVILAALVGPLILQLAESDSRCQTNPSTGFSSGVDGTSCIADLLNPWNETLWRHLNGTGCSILDSFGSTTTTHATSATSAAAQIGIVQYDIGLSNIKPSCANALSEYRLVTGFTCNCTGDYAFLTGGLRPGAVLTVSTSIYYFIMVFLAPVVGALADVTPHRKKMFAVFAIMYIISIAGMSIVDSGYLWVVSMVFSTAAGPSYDIMTIPVNAYLPEIHHKEIIRAKYSGFSTAANYSAQFIFGFIMSILTVTLQTSIGSVGVGQISCILCAIWIASFTGLAYKRMGKRAAGHPRDPNHSLIKASFGSIKNTTILLYNEHPMALRYLLTNIFGATAIVVNIALLTTYLAKQMKMDGSQIVIVYLLVMSSGAPISATYGTLNKCFGAKKLYIFIMIFAMFCNGIVPLLINQPNQQYAVYIFAPIAGGYFGLFFAMQSLIFSNFIPVGEEAGCYGLQTFSSSVARWFPPLIYSAIVQRLNDHRIALIHLCIFYFIAAILMCFVDFKQGKEDVAKKGRLRISAVSPPISPASKCVSPNSTRTAETDFSEK